MLQILKYVNANGDSITFTSSYLLKKVTGLAETDVVHTTYQGVRQNGETYRYSDFEKREITIDFNIISDDRVNYMSSRNTLIKTLNPILGEGYLYYTYGTESTGIIERRIKCIPASTPILPIESNKYYTEGSITFIAFDPFFEDIGYTNAQFLNLSYSNPVTKNVSNTGHVSTPLTIEIIGACNAPTISYTNNNVDGKPKKIIKVNKPLSSGQTMTIKTGYGAKSVIITEYGKDPINAFNYIDLNTDFFELGVGANNSITCSDAGNTGTSNFYVNIKYWKRYLGV